MTKLKSNSVVRPQGNPKGVIPKEMLTLNDYQTAHAKTLATAHTATAHTMLRTPKSSLENNGLDSGNLESNGLESNSLENSVDSRTSAFAVSSSVDLSKVEPPKIDLLGMDFDNFSKQELLSNLDKGVVFTPNVDHLMKLRRDPDFVLVYEKADFKVCDSQILMYASKFLGKPLKAKLSGSDLFPWFCEYHKHNENIKIFLLGGREGVAREARKRVNERTGREIVIGEYSPPYGFESDAEECSNIIELIKSSSANVLAVCLGAPKQEKWIATYRDQLPNIDIFMAIGAAVDFEAGCKPRAPQYVSELGLEWLYRLVCEPRRLWRRYLVEGMPFVGLVLAEKAKQVLLPNAASQKCQ